MRKVDLVHVFTIDGTGGNPCPIVMEAGAMTADEMQELARTYGLEASFLLPPSSGDYDVAIRFFVPSHEMEMCGHATVGSLWLLASAGLLPGRPVRVETRSGPVLGFIRRGDGGEPDVEITQPVGRLAPIAPAEQDEVLAALGVERAALADLPFCNAVTSRVKTVVPLADAGRLNALDVDARAIEAVCTRIDSTGLYPYALLDARANRFEARQFPRASGFVEDAATGIAATALAFALLSRGLADPGRPAIEVLQGRAMGRLSRIRVRIEFDGERATGCLLGGAVTRA